MTMEESDKPAQIKWVTFGASSAAVAGALISLFATWPEFQNSASRFWHVVTRTKPQEIAIPPFESGPMTGGASAETVCKAAMEKYKAQYADYDVGVRSFEAHTQTPFGPTKYRYTCYFSTKLKK